MFQTRNLLGTFEKEFWQNKPIRLREKSRFDKLYMGVLFPVMGRHLFVDDRVVKIGSNNESHDRNY